MQKRNKFSLSHYKLLTADMGYLVPLTWFEVLPGDTIQQSTSCLIRCTPMLKPIMHPCIVRIHHFYVPNRLMWDDWESFITGGEDGMDTSVHPYKERTSVTESSLLDYLGLPATTFGGGFDLNALPLRAYIAIYNEHYRDQDLSNAGTMATSGGADTTTNVGLLKASWPKDYYTTSRPWEYKGSAVTVPLGQDAPVLGIGKENTTFADTNQTVYESDGTTSVYDTAARIDIDSVGQRHYVEQDGTTGFPNIHTDLTNAGVDLNDFRLALALQKYQERMGRHGSRYAEYLASMGVRSSDARLQNPEYLGGGRQTIQFSEVLSTDGANTGDMKGHGIAAMKTNKYRRFFEEHGIVMTIMSVVPKPIYTDAIPKQWWRSTKEDYYQKELVNLGEQPILNKEVQSENTSPDEVFGYQAQYNEYRYQPSQVHGEFRSTENDWHLAREFSGDVSLNKSFTDCTPSKRVFASQSTDCLYVMANHSIQARRMLPKFSTPKIVG